MTVTMLLLSGAYALVAALLVLLLLATRLPFFLKGLATVATCGMILWTYQAIGELRGLPTDSEPPAHFKLHWARVVEPNPLMKEKGHVFMCRAGMPRAYALAYDPDLVKKVGVAMGKIKEGEEVSGTITDEPAEEISETAEALAQEVKEGTRRAGPNSGEVGERYFDFDPEMLTFGEVAAPITPSKD